MKKIVKTVPLKTTIEMKHMLACLLKSYKFYLERLDYHGNINPQAIIAVPNKNDDISENPLENKIKITDYDYKLIFTHVDYLTKEDWVTRKIFGLNSHKRSLALLFEILYFN